MARNLIACCDGTWKTEDDPAETNVVRLWRAIARQSPDHEDQVKYYDRGVGSGGIVARILGGITGRGIEKNVKDVYAFLARNYRDGDRIYLFGFSRGAYTARSVGGFVRKCGLLKPSELGRLDEAFDVYRDEHEPSEPEPSGFREDYSRNVVPHCIGVWDTVGALGLPLGTFSKLLSRKHEFHDVELSSTIQFAFHAVAIDERRLTFEPTLWKVSKNRPADSTQRVEQRWFVGVHSNVGGGYGGGVGLSSITLRWMADRARDAGLGLSEPVLNEEYSPDYAGSLGGPAWFYRRFRDRVIDAVWPDTESVDTTATRRWDDHALSYRPPPLVEHRKRL